MISSLRLLAVLNAALVLGSLGCGDEGGSCGPAPEKKEEAQQGAGGSSRSAGGSSGAAELITQDKKGRVPKAYQREKSAYEPKRTDEEPEKSTATIKAPVIPLSPAGRKARSLPIATIIKRRVDGVADRVEIKCRILAASADGSCSGSANYDEIKERCCPGGLVERCRAASTGILLVGRGCEPGLKQE